MTLRTFFGVLLGLAAAAFGVAAALGVASLPRNWSRIGVLISIAGIWVLWELLVRLRARAYGTTPPPAPSPVATRMAAAIAVAITLAIVIAVALGWLPL